VKNQDAINEDISYDYWDSPVKIADQLGLLTLLQDSRHVRFFFLKRLNEEEELYELTISTGNSYKVTEENQGWKTNEYFFDGKGPKGELQKCRTYKFWNTPYAKDTYCSGLMLAEHEKNPEHIFEYVIICQDAWVEFFTRAEPKWTRLEKGTKIADLIVGYLKDWGPG
jgi:hypothetical protein